MSTELDLSDLLRFGGSDLAIGTADPDESAGVKNGTLLMPYSAREAHMHILGITQSGKSRFMADLIQQDIMNGYGLCLIDPHGETYKLIVNWLAQNDWIAETYPNIHPISFSDPGTMLRYNPLHINEADEAYAVSGNVVEAITRIFGGKDSNDTPLFSFVLDVACTILALRGLPLAAVDSFLMDGAIDTEIRNKISDGVPDERFRELGLQMSRMGAKEFRDNVGSTGRRMHKFLRNPLVRRIFSTTENTMDLRHAMDEGHILLFDTSREGRKLLKSELDLIGSLFVNNIFGVAETRPASPRPHPFMLYIDEVQNYVNNDIEDILSQAAKRGLYLTLAHQFLGQLVQAGELVYNGVMAGTRIKAIFQIQMDDADVLVDEMFADRIDFELVKEKLKTPHVVGHEIIKLQSTTESEGEGYARGTNSAVAESHADGTGETETDAESDGTSVSEMDSVTTNVAASESAYLPDNPALDAPGVTLGTSSAAGAGRVVGHTATHATAHSRANSRTHVDSYSRSKGISEVESMQKTTGRSEAESLESIIEWFSTTTYSLEDQRYDWKRALAFQKKRHGFIAVGREGTRGFTTRDVPDRLDIPEIEALLLQELRHKSPWISVGVEIPDVRNLPEMKAILEAPKKGTPAEQEPNDYFEPDEPS